MLEHPVPSISWRTPRQRVSLVHFRWEFGTGETACSKHVPEGAKVDSTQNRQITCHECLYQIYDIQNKRPQNNLLFVKIMKNNDELVKLIWREVDRFEANGGKLGAQKRLAEAIGIKPDLLNDILWGRASVTDKVARYFGYTKVVGFIKDENYRQ